MAFLGEEITLDTLPEPTNNFEPLPAGWYTTTITGAGLKNTKAGDGKYIAVKYTVLGPTHQGRVIFGNVNIRNPSAQAEEIGRQNLGDLMRAIGLARVKDTDELIGGNCSIKLTVKEDEKYGNSNDVKAWKALDGAAPPMASTAPAANGKAAPPWAKK